MLRLIPALLLGVLAFRPLVDGVAAIWEHPVMIKVILSGSVAICLIAAILAGAKKILDTQLGRMVTGLLLDMFIFYLLVMAVVEMWTHPWETLQGLLNLVMVCVAVSIAALIEDFSKTPQGQKVARIATWAFYAAVAAGVAALVYHRQKVADDSCHICRWAGPPLKALYDCVQKIPYFPFTLLYLWPLPAPLYFSGDECSWVCAFTEQTRSE